MKRYEKYRPSGVEWIGEIPARWEVKRLKFNTYIKARVGWHGLRADEFSLTDGVFCITGTDLQNGKVNWKNCYRVSEDRYNEDPYIQVKEKDLLITKDGTIGKVAVVQNLREKATLNSGVFVVRPEREQYSTPYMYWAFQSPVFSEYVYYASKGSTINHLYQETFFNLPFILPQPPEQTAIAAYLDEKTARIDKLIANKQRLIELLKEERTAIINNAATKGINPKAKLKNSGIEWLGDIPEHWEVKKLKYVAAIKYGLGQPPTQKDDGLPLIRATNVERGKIVDKDLIFVDPDDIPYDRDPVLKENDIIVVRSGAYTADSAIIPKKYEGAITGYDMVVRVNNDNAIFISYCLLSQYVLINQLYLQRLRAAQPHLNKEELGETFLLLPTIQEQQRIVQYIETSTQKIDATIAKIEKEIELMQEYRTALISEVVTGKIMVI